MTPQLQQAIRLLQLSRLELIDEIRKELDAQSRPRGRRDRPAPATATRRAPRTSMPTPSPHERAPRSSARASASASSRPDRRSRPRQAASRRSTGSSSSRTARSSSRSRRAAAASRSCRRSSRTSPSRRTSSITCCWQLQMSDFTETERRFAELVIGNLDEKGYLDLKGIERADGDDARPTSRIEDLADEAGARPRGRARGPARSCRSSIRSASARAICASACASRPRSFGYDDLEIDDHRQAPPQPREAQLPGASRAT